ncbi:cytochrome P450 [Colletotrichum navitas]|uniref:Cytochrome P450 n=1 Tax=Colletotrichum navitas TaxID=681940 RepID=A0AAD8UYC6_9PEZI|nr:cytochrome P450 [Colletotrichum navitas]KAK1565925.1 cytochrome P450 [Colletotrichum navitas]
MALILTTIVSLGVLFLSTAAYRFISNVVAAKSTGLPVLVYPVDPNNLFWILVSVPLRPWLKRNIPTRVWKRLVLTIYGWEFYERRRPFDEYGAVKGGHRTLVVASAGGVELWTADPVVATEVLRRTGDFHMPALTGLFLGHFGPNVLTTNGERWARQRKVVAAVINDRISKAIFDSAIRQTEGMLGELFSIEGTEKSQTNVAESTALFDNIKRITIHVLSEAGMGAVAPWRHQRSERPKPGFQMTYIQACKVVMEHCTGAIVIPNPVLLNWPSWLPGHQRMRQLGIGKREFPIHTESLLDEERRRISNGHAMGPEGRATIMNHLLRASATQGDARDGLTQEELKGNLFLFTAAGFETTANTLTYALVLLARYPEWQDWLFGEVDSLMSLAEEGLEPDYAAVFPKVRRIMAVMLETLRLFTPTVHVIRTSPTAQKLDVSNGTILLPASATVLIDNIALHMDPKAWRDNNHESDPAFVQESTGGETVPDECRFRPSRWIDNTGKAGRTLVQPPKGYFIPWGYGPRVCPGQKMGQVEFAAVMLKLLHHHRLQAVALPGEDKRAMEQRLDGMMQNSVPKMTLVMDGVYDVGESGGLRMRIMKRD